MHHKTFIKSPDGITMHNVASWGRITDSQVDKCSYIIGQIFEILRQEGGNFTVGKILHVDEDQLLYLVF